MPNRNVVVIYIGILILTFSIILGFLLSIYYHGFSRFYEVNFGEFAVAMGTILLAFFTFQLALREIEEGRRMRQLMSDEYIKERNRLRLKEQLENFYSPLMSEIDIFGQFDQHYIATGKINILLKDMKSKYLFYASDELKNQLKEYYDNFHSRDTIYLRNLRVERGSDYTDNFLTNKLDSIRKTIMDDWINKTQEYNKLTRV